ncbi:GNAT family N-acetyltransferase [Actinomadura atramentaria]|uniref:GNAT family N-acetyltransferase n=1 Tax=Actinomadura atramentaria TaxID=1990 RepID=UPI000371212A|nr:GNAT family protein [Actinomadura atramentaria]
MLRPRYPLRTRRLLLRPFEPGDLDGLYAYQSLPDVTRYLTWEPRTREESRLFLRQKMDASTLEREGDWLVAAVVHSGSGELMGEINLGWRSREHRQGEIGYVINPAYHGHGYATEAAAEGLRLGFEEFGLHRVVGRIDARNEASARVLERLGMRREAHLRENEFVKGEWSDEIVYAILRREWDAHRGTTIISGE